MADFNSGGDGPVVIKKYANRRLYNTATASFVTLDDLHDLVKEGQPFVVQDAKSGRDITCSVLAQILAEEEIKGHNMLPLNYLRQVLKAYSEGVGPQLSNYLEQSMETFATNQQQMMKQMQNMFGGAVTVEQLADIGRRNMEMFQSSLGAFAPQSEGHQSETPDPQNREAEIERLKGQLGEIQRRLDALSQGT